MKPTLVYAPAILSIFAFAAYSAPWTLGATRNSLGFYLIGMLWFCLIGWPVAGVYALSYAKSRSKPHLIVLLVLILTYIAFVISLGRGFFVTV